jgi:hypothetical protein
MRWATASPAACRAVYTGLTNLDVADVATTAPIKDFRHQERIRIGGYGNLPAVAQGALISRWARLAMTAPPLR